MHFLYKILKRFFKLMLLLSIFLQFIKSDCKDYEIPSHSRSFINSLRSLKSSKSMLLFGIDSYADFPIVSSFEELKEKVLPFIMGQFYTNFLIFILGLVAFFFFISCTILITTCCTPRERSKPGFFTTIIWWIIFSILFLVSIIYFILSIAYAPNFINNFHEIPEIVQNSFTNIINDTNLFISKYKDKVLELFTENENAAVYPSFALLMHNRTTTTVQTFVEHLHLLRETIEYDNDNFSLLEDFASDFNSSLTTLASEVKDFIGLQNSNTITIYEQNRLTIPVLYDFSTLKWTDAQTTINHFRFNEIEKSKKSFDTNRDYVKIPLKCINIIILILVIAFYVFQTITFFTQTAFSRCCAISIYPISIVASVGITIFGIFATSVSCSIGDICSDSSRFVSQYFFIRNESRLNYPIPIYNPQLFDSPNNNLFTSIGGQYLINFEDIIQIENVSSNINNNINMNGRTPTFDIPEEQNYSYIYDELIKLYNKLAFNYTEASLQNSTELEKLTRFIRNVFDVISDVNYRYSIQFNALKTIVNSYKDIIDITPDYRDMYFQKSSDVFIPSLINFTNQVDIYTSSFCCPVRETKKVFCKDTASTFSCFSIFAHFYVLSLIGFGIVLCFRRQGMLSNNYGIEDNINETEKRKKDQSNDDEPKTVDFIRPSQGTNRESNPWTMSDASDSESKSSFTTLDMYAQSKIL